MRPFRILFQLSITLVSRALLGFSFSWVLRLYLSHSYDCLSFDYYVCISRTFRILFQLIITFVSCALLGFSAIRLLRLYLAHFYDSLSFDYNVGISCTFRILSFDYYVSILRPFRILFQLSITFVSRALLGFSFIWLLRLYLVHF